MLKKHAVEGFDDFKAKAEVLSKEDLPLFVYFSGSKTGDGKFTVVKYIWKFKNTHNEICT